MSKLVFEIPLKYRACFNVHNNRKGKVILCLIKHNAMNKYGGYSCIILDLGTR
jgi:hypothetical protein